MATHSSTLAWQIPWAEEPGGLPSLGLHSQTRLKRLSSSSSTPMDRSTKQKISKETQTLNDTMDWLGLIHIYGTLHPKTMNFTFFSSAYRTFSGLDHILSHKFNFGKFKNIYIISNIFSDHNMVRLDVNYRNKCES